MLNKLTVIYCQSQSLIERQYRVVGRAQYLGSDRSESQTCATLDKS